MLAPTAAALALLFLAGCSQGSKETERTGNTSDAVSAATTTTMTPADTRFTGQDKVEFCNLARSFNDRSQDLDSSETATGLRTASEEARTAVNQAAAAAPAEIKRDVEVVASAFTGLVDAIEKADYEASRVDLTSLQAFQTPEFEASSVRFQAYMRDVCEVTG